MCIPTKSTAYTPSYVSVHVRICMYVNVSLCTVSAPNRLRQFSDNLHSSFCLSIWKRDTSGVCTSHQPRILIRKKNEVQASETTEGKKKKHENKSIHNSYWQTTPRNIWRILKSLFFPSGIRYCLPYSPFPTTLPQSHQQTSGFTQQNKSALLRAPTLVKAAPLLTIGTRENDSCSFSLEFPTQILPILVRSATLLPPTLSICKQGGGCVHAGGLAAAAQTQSRSLCPASAP